MTKVYSIIETCDCLISVSFVGNFLAWLKTTSNMHWSSNDIMKQKFISEQIFDLSHEFEKEGSVTQRGHVILEHFDELSENLLCLFAHEIEEPSH